MIASVAIVFAFGWAIHTYAKSITGPFLWGDELAYFLYGHDLFAGAGAGDPSIGPLYPLVLAMFFHLHKITSVYHASRLFNLIVQGSSVVPMFLLARALFPGARVLWILLSILAATTAFSAYVDLIWAEPLYFALFNWLALSLFMFYQRPQIGIGGIVGALLGLLFYTKVGAGLVAQLATFASLVALVGTQANRSRRSAFVGPVLAMLVTCSALTIPWIFRNMSLGAGPIGYQHIWGGLGQVSATFGVLAVVQRVFWSAFYQLSYVFLATYGLLAVPTVIVLSRWNAMPIALRGLTVFLAACTSGLIALVSIGNNGDIGGQEYWMPFGRYLSVVCPAIVIVSLSLLKLEPGIERHERRWVIAATVFFAIITALATPLMAANVSRAIIMAPDLALATTVFTAGQIGNYDATLAERVGLAALLAGLGLMAIRASRERNTFYCLVGLVLALSLATSATEHRYMTTAGAIQSPVNDTTLFLYKQGDDPARSLGIDRKYEEGNIGFDFGFDVDFWTTSRFPVRFLRTEEIVRRAREWGLKYFISPEVLPIAAIHNSEGIYVYLLDDRALDALCAPEDCPRSITFDQSHKFEISLAQGGNGALFADDHWSFPESWGRWTAATQAAISFSVGAPRDIGIELLVGPILSPRAPKQSVWIEANGCRVGAVEFDLAHASGPQTISGVIPGGCIDAAGKIVLRINSDRASTPKELGINGDPRQLAVAVQRLVVRDANVAAQ